jgi:hypothetical protein
METRLPSLRSSASRVLFVTTSPPLRQATPAWLDSAFYALLLCFVLLVLALPVFPTSDGPVHIYFSEVLGQLASGPTPYAQVYSIRHLLQPYSLHYYALIGLMQVLPAAWAEKLVVVAILTALAFGFRFLARALGPYHQVASLLQFPLLLSWPLGGGFMNYCFAIGVSLGAFGLWYRAESSHRPARLAAAYVSALVVLVISHPVPLLVLILLTSLDLLLVLLHYGQLRRAWAAPGFRLRLGLFLASCVSFVVPLLLADKATAGSAWKQFGPNPTLLLELLTGTRVSLFGGFHPLALLYQVAVILAMPAAIALQWSGLRSRWSQGELRSSDRLLLFSVGYTLLLLSFPPTMNGSAHFAERMWLITWLLALATLAGADLTAAAMRRLSWSAVAWSVLTLVLAAATLLPVARKQAALAQAPLPSGQRGLFLQPSSTAQPALLGSNDELDFWDGGRAFAERGDILLNSPWMNLTIMPVRERAGTPMIDHLMMSSPGDSPAEQPVDLYRDMVESAQARARALQGADFVLYADPVSPTPQPLADVSKALGTRAGGADGDWRCQAYSFYAICTRR